MERLLARLERRYGRYALTGLTYYLVAIQALVLIMDLTNRGFSDNLLVLDRDEVLHGQVWRLVTYLFIPPSNQPIWALFALYWLYTIGVALETQWGAFRYQTFLLVGMVCTTAFAFALGLPAGNTFLLMSLFLAFATLWPNFEFLILFIVPVKVKWLAFLDALALLSQIGLLHGWQKVLPLVAIGNYLLFFGPMLVDYARGSVQRARGTSPVDPFRQVAHQEDERRRQCTLCGVTDEDREIEFRVCTCDKCGKPTEFCLAHARNH